MDEAIALLKSLKKLQAHKFCKYLSTRKERTFPTMGITNQKVFSTRILRKIMNLPVYIQKKSIFFLKLVIKLYIPTLIILAFFIFISWKTKIPISIFLKDPAVIADSNALMGSNLNITINPFVGAVSNIGILLWCFSSSICFFSYVILKEHKKINNNQLNKLANFLFYSGILTAFLLLDDLFLLHETVAPELLNISQTVIYVCLAIVTLFWVLTFRRVILRTE